MSFPLEKVDLTLVESLAEVEAMMQWLGQRREFLAVDCETTGLNVGCDRIRMVQFGDATHGWALSYRDWRGVVKEVIETYDRPMVAHNLLYDSKMLKADGIVIPQRLAHCSMVMAHLTNPVVAMGLKPSAVRYLDTRAAAGQDVLKAAMSQQGWTFGTVPLDFPGYWQYAALDTALTSPLAEKLYPDINKRAYELEVGVIHCLREAEIAGLLVDEEYRARCAARLISELATLRERIPIKNPDSDKQVVDYLLGINAPLTVRTEHGNLSVDKHVLEWLKDRGFEVCGPLSEYRSKSRFLGNYIDKFGERGMPNGYGEFFNRKGDYIGLAVDGLLHASTKPVEARTGRMSVTDPPMQTLPRGRLVRDAIVAPEGECFVMADFAGMELRVLASFAQEPTMLAAFEEGLDLHNMTAEKLYGAAFTKPQRTLCKNGGFANIYGAGVEKFAVTAGVDIAVAQEFRDAYDEMFPGIKGWKEQVAREVIESAGGKRTGNGYVTLVDGRRLPVEAGKAYKGVNFLIQGSCAVSLKERIVALSNAGLGGFFRLAVHDELLFQVPNPEAAAVVETITEVMPDRDNYPGTVLEVEADCVQRWGEHYRGDFPAYIETEAAPWL
jgi:DNA polymerase-1